MGITRQEVRHIAQLARLRFEGEEEERFTREMARIVDYVRRLEEVDTEGVEPLAHVLDLENVMDPDRPRPSIDRDTILGQAPRTHGEFFQFPRVIEDTGDDN